MSSNTWTENIKPRIIADSREYLRRQTAWLNVVNGDFSAASGKIGDTVDVPVPMDSSVTDLSAGQLPPVASGVTFNTVQLKIEKAKSSVPFTVEQIHLQNYAISGPNSVLQQQINAQIDAVIGQLATDFAANYINIPTFVGTAGAEFFNPTGSTATIDQLGTAQRALFEQKVPTAMPKTCIMSAKDFEKMWAVQEVRQAYSIGTPAVIQDAEFPSIGGFKMLRDYFAPYHTAGTITTGLSVTGVNAAGSTSLVCATAASTGACALKAGDIIKFTVGSTTYQYSLQADATQASAASAVTLSLDRGLEVATAGSEAVTLATNFGTGRTLIFGDMTGCGIVTRVPSNPQDIPEMPVKIMGEHVPITDPVSGITVLLSFYGQYFQRTMITSLVYGSKIYHPARLVRGLSKNTP